MKRMRTLVWMALACGLSACGLTTQGAVQQYSSPYCTKLQSCAPADFSQVYGGGVQDCIGQLELGTETETKDTSCSIASCKSDINNITCTNTVATMPLPASCQACAAAN